MYARFQVTEPDKIEVTMVLTMTVKQWKDLRDTLKDEWPAADLSMKISDLVNQVDKHFYPEARREG